MDDNENNKTSSENNLLIPQNIKYRNSIYVSEHF